MVVAHAFNPSTHSVGRGREVSVSLRPTWSTVLGQSDLLYRETLSQKTKIKANKKTTGVYKEWRAAGMWFRVEAEQKHKGGGRGIAAQDTEVKMPLGVNDTGRK